MNTDTHQRHTAKRTAIMAAAEFGTALIAAGIVIFVANTSGIVPNPFKNGFQAGGIQRMSQP